MKYLILALICSISLLQAKNDYLTKDDIRKLVHQEIKVKIDRYASDPLYTNETEDGFGHKYKRFVFCGPYSKSKERLNQGGGAVSYYWNSFLSVKTGPSYAKGLGIEKLWKWSLQMSCEISSY